jgi:hypothetical protein
VRPLLLVASLIISLLIQNSAAGQDIRGATVVVFGENVWYRNETVIIGLQQALTTIPGVSVLVPRSRFYSLQNLDLAGIETIIEIYRAEVISREDKNINFSVGGLTSYATLTRICVRLGLRILRVVGNGSYLQFVRSSESDGCASGITYVYNYTPTLGSITYSSLFNIETTAFKNAAASIFRY